MERRTAYSMLMTIAPLLAMTPAITLTSCSKKDDAYAAFVEQRARTLCELSFRCCSEEQLYKPTVEECMDHGKWPYEQAVNEGTASIDFDKANDCFQEVDAMSCAEWQAALEGETPDACKGIISARSDGDSCSSPYECSSGYCKQASADSPSLYDSSAPGTCAPLGAVGDACILRVLSCEIGLACRGTRDAATCQEYPIGGPTCENGQDCQAGVCNDGACADVCYGHPASPTLLGESW